MNDVFRQTHGDLPLLISVPHDGREIPEDVKARMTAIGLAIPDTDWHVAQLYDFAIAMGATMLVANYSRYVVDLNRACDDAALYPGQVATGLCPEHAFSGEPIYEDGSVSEAEKALRVEQYWRPYHDQIRDGLAAMRERHGYALLWDAHSIPSNVPRLFDGELPELNLGSNAGASCGQPLQDAVADVAMGSNHSAVVNGRFKGGHITRQYGDPENNVHALQLEISQRAYMNEQTTEFDVVKADRLRATLSAMLTAYLDAAEKA